MSYFPLFVDLKDKNILVVGGGNVAFRKIVKLLPFEAKITIVSPKICSEIAELLVQNKNLTYKQKSVDIDDIKNAYIAITATDEASVNAFVAQNCKNNNIFVNSVDDIENCSFIFPALIKKDSFVMGCTTSGKAPYVSAYLKNIIENDIPENLDEIIENIAILRQELKLKIKEQNIRAKVIHLLLEYYQKHNFNLGLEELKSELNSLIDNVYLKN